MMMMLCPMWMWWTHGWTSSSELAAGAALFAWSSRATRGKARCALHLFVALLFSKFDIV
jgi:hypothetical protein